MVAPKLLLPPESSSLSAAFGVAVVRAGVPGGAPRARLDQLGAPTTVAVGWVATPGEFAYLGAFYRSRIANGSEPFLIDLPLESAIPTEHEAHFMPGSFKLNGISGLTHTATAQLEVVTPTRDGAADMALVDTRAPAVGGLPVMALTPSLDSYAVQRGDSVLRTQPGLGPSTFRLSYPNTTSRVSVSWNVGPADVPYLLAFYFSAIAEGALPFLVESVHDHPDPRQLKASLVPGSFSLASVRGMTYTFRAELDVVPMASPAYDQQVLDLFETLGPEWDSILSELEVLVLDYLPLWS